MQSGLGPTEDPDKALLRVSDTLLTSNGGDLTAVTATGDGIRPLTLAHIIARLDAEGVVVAAAGVTDGVLIAVVGRRDGPDALRYIEDAVQ
jgi:hypothetical protein